MIKDALLVLASSIILVLLWLTYIQPGLTPVKIEDPYKESLFSEVIFERNLLTQKNNFTGKVKIIKDSDGQIIIRLENISQELNFPVCPNIQVLLTLDFNPQNGISLGPLKGTEGSMNYFLPVDENIKNYNSVVVWCKSFKSDYAHVEILSPSEKPLFIK